MQNKNSKLSWFFQSNLKNSRLAIHVFQLHDDGPATEELEEDIAAANHWLLPTGTINTPFKFATCNSTSYCLKWPAILKNSIDFLSALLVWKTLLSLELNEWENTDYITNIQGQG